MGMSEEEQLAEQQEKMMQQMEFFRTAPTRFLAAWKRGCLISPQYFGDGTVEGIEAATDKWQLAPNTEAIKKAVRSKSPGEAIFLAAMVSFYNDATSRKIQKAAGQSDGVGNLLRMDWERRQVIADLLVNYAGW